MVVLELMLGIGIVILVLTYSIVKVIKTVFYGRHRALAFDRAKWALELGDSRKIDDVLTLHGEYLDDKIVDKLRERYNDLVAEQIEEEERVSRYENRR